MENPRRKQIRLQCYDYSTCGFYFVTVCAFNRKNIFGYINPVGADPCVRPESTGVFSDTHVHSNPAGIVAENRLHCIEDKFKGVYLDYYCIMPNHVHFLLFLKGGHAGPPLPSIMQWYKTQTTNDCIKLVKKE